MQQHASTAGAHTAAPARQQDAPSGSARAAGGSYAGGAAALTPRENIQMRRRAPASEPAEAAPAAPEAEDAAPAAPPSRAEGVVAQQMQEGGIRVVLAKLPPEVGPTAARIAGRYIGRTLGFMLDRCRTQLGHLAGFRRVANGADRERVLTSADTAIFTAIAEGVATNDNAFRNWGTAHARSRNAIGPGLVVGQPVLYSESDDPLLALEAIAVAARATADGAPAPAASAPVPAAPGPGAQAQTGGSQTPGEQPTAPTPAPGRRRRRVAALASTRNVAELAIFTHGWHDGVAIGRGEAPGNELAARLSPACANGVNIQLFACSAASGDDSFAERLAAGLAQTGHDARVFGHTSAGRADTNGNGREFSARAGEQRAHGATNFQVVFDEAYIQAQARRLTTELQGHDAAAVEQAMRRVLPHWNAVAMARVRVTPRGGGTPKPGTMAIGYARQETIDAVRRDWEQPSQGLETVRNALSAPAASGRRRVTRA